MYGQEEEKVQPSNSHLHIHIYVNVKDFGIRLHLKEAGINIFPPNSFWTCPVIELPSSAVCRVIFSQS